MVFISNSPQRKALVLKKTKKKRRTADMKEALLRVDFGKSPEFILSLRVCAMENIRGCFCQCQVQVCFVFFMSQDLMALNEYHSTQTV